MSDELIDICDENGNIIGTAMKSEALAKGLWHRTARVLLYNSKGEVFTQLRSKSKELHPGKWDVGAAGHVGAGEHHLDAALREVAEEVGLNFAKDDLELIMEEKYENNSDGLIEKGFTYTYFARLDGKESEIKIQEEEIQTYKLIDIDELENERKQFAANFVPHSGKYWRTLIDGVKKLTGK